MKPLAVGLIAVLGGVSALLWRQAARLQLPRTQESMLLPDHMFSRAAAALEDDDKVRAAAHGGSLRTTALPGCVVFGLAAIDRSDETSRFAIDTHLRWKT